MVAYQEWKNEQDNWRRFKAEVDALTREIMEGKIAGREELKNKVEALRTLCRGLFPERSALFEMIYPGRFTRQWEQFGRGR